MMSESARLHKRLQRVSALTLAAACRPYLQACLLSLSVPIHQDGDAIALLLKSVAFLFWCKRIIRSYFEDVPVWEVNCLVCA